MEEGLSLGEEHGKGVNFKQIDEIKRLICFRKGIQIDLGEG